MTRTPGSTPRRPLRAALRVAPLAIALALGCDRAPPPPGESRGVAGPSGVVAPIDLDARPLEDLLREALDEPVRLRRVAAVANLLDQLPPDALDAVVSAFEGSFFDQGDIELVLLAEWWAGFDPRAALAWTEESWSAQHPRIEPAIMRAWARRAPTEVRDALYDRRHLAWTPIARQELIEALVVGWFESGEAGLLEWLASLHYPADQQRALAVLARLRVLRDGADATIQWAQALPEEPANVKRWLVQRVAGAVTSLDPERGAQYATRLVGNDLYAVDVVTRVATRWAMTQPIAALDWLERTELSETVRDTAVDRTFKRWHGRRPAAASAWLVAKPPAGWLDPARRAYAAGLWRESEVDWNALMEQILLITDEERRWSTALRAVQRWLVDDSAAAEAWLAAQTLPAGFAASAREIPPGVRQERERIAQRGPLPPL